jgi:hypothetical protein
MKKRDIRQREMAVCYSVISKSIGEMFCSFAADLILREIEFSECLCEMKEGYLMKGKERVVCVTVLFRRASARCCVPLSPILFCPRDIRVSVCVKSGREIFDGEKWRCVLPCYFEEHQRDVVPLCRRFYFVRDIVL